METGFLSSIAKNQTTKAAAIVGAALALGGAFYYLSGIFEEKAEEQEDGSDIQIAREHQPGLPTNQLTLEEMYEQLAFFISQEELQYSKETILCILDAVEKTSRPTFNEITKAARFDRRRVGLSNVEEYLRIMAREQDLIVKVIGKTIEDVLARTGGDLMTYTYSQEFWRSQDHEFSEKLSKMQAVIKYSYKIDSADSRMTLQLQKQVIQFAIDNFEKIQVPIENPHDRLMVKKSVLYDMIFEKFGVEEGNLKFEYNLDPEYRALETRFEEIYQKAAQL